MISDRIAHQDTINLRIPRVECFADRAATATSVATLQAQATVHGYRVVFTYAAIFLVAGAVIAGLLLRRGAVASLAIAGRSDKPGVTAPDPSGEPIPLNA